MRKRGFTLIEVLVVVAIIAVLAGLLFPVFARAKASAKKTTCINNLSQIGKAIATYMSDNNDIFPHALDTSDKYVPEIWAGNPEWQARIPTMPLLHDVLQAYAKSQDIFHCPSDDGTSILDNHFPVAFQTAPSLFVQYGSSYFYRSEIGFRFFSDTAFQLPANVNVLFDGAGHWHGDATRLNLGDDFTTYPGKLKKFRYNTLYGDWHAKSLNYDQWQDAWSVPL